MVEVRLYFSLEMTCLSLGIVRTVHAGSPQVRTAQSRVTATKACEGNVLGRNAMQKKSDKTRCLSFLAHKTDCFLD